MSFKVLFVIIIIGAIIGLVSVLFYYVRKQERHIKTRISDKSLLAVMLLCLFFGMFGLHRFYLGKIGTGLLMLFTAGGAGIWVFIDFIVAAAGIMKDKEGYFITKW